MQKRNLDNKMLDAIGRKLFEAKVTPFGDIEKIVSNPLLYEMVTKRIAENGKLESVAESAAWFSGRKIFAFAGVAAVIVLAIGAFSIFRSEKAPVVATIVQIPDAVPEVARPVFPPQGMIVGKLSTGRATKADFRKKETARLRTVERGRRPKLEIETDTDFFPVAYTGDPAETVGGGHILRVDLKRSSLFAIGVNLPLENDDELVKADLLIGSDGVTRAVRVVN